MNDLPGFETYNWEYQLAERLGKKLEGEISKERKAGRDPIDLSTEMQRIKTFAAELLSLRAVNASKKP